MANKTNELENQRLGRLLAYAREMKKVSQAEMVEKTGLTKNHISAVERGVSKPSIEMLLGYCDKLELTPNDILGYNADGIIPELRVELSKMDEAKQQKMLDMIRLIDGM